MKIAVIDIETTGLQPDRDLIVEIAATELDLSDGSTAVLFDELIKENRFNESCQDSWVFRNSNLKFEDILTRGKSLDDVRLDLQMLLDHYHVTAFNSAFDIGFLQSRGFAIPHTLPCIMKSATPVVQIEDYRGRYKWPSVDEAWKFFFPDDPYKEKHRAADDAVHEARILYKMYSSGKYILKDATDDPAISPAKKYKHNHPRCNQGDPRKHPDWNKWVEGSKSDDALGGYYCKAGVDGSECPDCPLWLGCIMWMYDWHYLMSYMNHGKPPENKRLDDSDEVEMEIIHASYAIEANAPVIELFGRCRDGSSVVVLYRGFRPYCYFEDNEVITKKILREMEGKITGYEEVELEHMLVKKKFIKIYTTLPLDVRTIRNKYDKETTFMSADILFPLRFMYDMDLGQYIRATGTEITSDRYTVDRVINADSIKNIDPYQQNLSILSFDIETSLKKNEILTISIWAEQHDGEIIQHQIAGSEKDILTEFAKRVTEIDPDIITGYNIIFYDLPKIDERAKKHKLHINIGRDGSALWSRKDKDRAFYEINGRIIADAWLHTKLIKRPQRETLDYVSRTYLGETKLDVNPKAIDEEWHKDPLLVMEYCLKDSELALRMLKYIKVVDKNTALATVASLPLSVAFENRTSTFADSLLIRMADRQDVAVPCTHKGFAEEKIQGAYVREPEPGIYKWVIILDFKSMYPAIMMRHNLCLTTYAPGIGEIETPVGAQFLSKDIREGMVPRIMQKLLDAREPYKKELKNAKAGKAPQHIVDFWDDLQYSVKVIANSFYGLFTSAFYRFTNRDIGSSITAFARDNIKHVISELESEHIKIIYGDSVSHDTLIPVKQNGMISFRSISDLFAHTDHTDMGKEYYHPTGIETLTIDSNGRAVFRPIKYVMRHRCNKKMFRIYLTNTWHVDVTEDHSLYGYINKCRMPDAQINERLTEVTPNDLHKRNIRSLVTHRNMPHSDHYSTRNYPVEMYEYFGLHIANGSLCKHNKDGTLYYYADLSCGIDKDDYMNKVITPLTQKGWIHRTWDKNKSRNKGDISSNGLNLLRILSTDFRQDRKIIADFIQYESPEHIRAFLRGAFSADGTVMIRNDRPIVRFTNTRLDFIDYMRKLLWRVGIAHSVFRENRTNSYLGKDSGTYSYHITIKDVPKFRDEIGFIQRRKQDRISSADYGLQKRTTKNHDIDLVQVHHIEQIPYDDYVYDIEVPDTHRFFANGILVHNTDSIFLQSPYENLEQSREFGQKLADRFTKDGYALEFEKVMDRWFTHGKKKRYYGHVVWPIEENYVRGYEMRRRDSFSALTSTLEKMFDLIMHDNASEAVKIAREKISDVRAGKVPIEELVISKSVRPEDAYDDPDNLAQVRCARQLKDQGHAIAPYMSVSWIVTNGRKSPQEVAPFISKETFMKTPDWEYYADRLARSFGRVTEVFGWDENRLYTGTQQTGLDRFG